MPFSASHSNQGKHNRNLPWSFPHPPCSLHPHVSNVGNPKTSPRPPRGSSFHLIWGSVLHPSSLSPFSGASSSHQDLSRFCCPDEGGNSRPAVICGSSASWGPSRCPSVLMATRGGGSSRSPWDLNSQPCHGPPHTAHLSWVLHSSLPDKQMQECTWPTNPK